MTRPYHNFPIDQLIRTVADSLEAHTSALFLKEGQRRLRLVSHHSLSRDVKAHSTIETGQGPVGWVMREQRPINISRFKKDSRTIGIYEKDVKVKSLVAVPLPEEAGVLMADSKTRLKFTDKHLSILASFGECAAFLLKNVHAQVKSSLLLSLLEWACRAEDFEEALLDLMDILQFNACLILRRIRETSFFKVESILGKVPEGYKKSVQGRRFPLESGVCAWMFRHSKGILLRSFGSDPKRSFVLERDEDIGPRETVLGLFFPAAREDVFTLDHALVFTGVGNTEVWPGELPNIIKRRLKRMVPWR